MSSCTRPAPTASGFKYPMIIDDCTRKIFRSVSLEAFDPLAWLGYHPDAFARTTLRNLQIRQRTDIRFKAVLISLMLAKNQYRASILESGVEMTRTDRSTAVSGMSRNGSGSRDVKILMKRPGVESS